MKQPRRGARQAEALALRFGLSREHIIGMRFAVNVFIATTIVWTTLRWMEDKNPIWAIASMVAASDPEPLEARRLFRSRLINVAVGCVVGFFFLLVETRSDWALPVALSLTVLISTWFVRIKTMWRQAPISAAVVIAAGIAAQSAQRGFDRALTKVAEVIYGCLIGLVVSLVMSKAWLIDLSEESPPET